MIRLLVAALLMLVPLGGAMAAKTLITNANGYTLDEGGKLRRFSTLLIGSDGRVMALLPKSASEPKLEAGDFRLDAEGRTLVPGLIDAHGQIMRLGLTLGRLDLADAASLSDAQAKIAGWGQRLAPGRWLLGQGWNEAAWGGTLPTADDLESQQPVWLLRAGRWMGWANRAAMEAAGVKAESKDPPGGQILRDAAGNPTGLFIGTAMQLIEQHVPPASAGERELALEAALRTLASVGLTGVHDMGTSRDDWQLYRNFADEGRLTIRITAYADGMAAMEGISPLRPTPSLYDGRLKLAGIRIESDGRLESRDALLLQPYADAPATSGLQLLDEARGKNLFSRANFLGYQLVADASGDAAIRQALDNFAEIRSYGDGFRNRIEAMQTIDSTDIERFAALHVVASVQPATFDAKLIAARLGSSRAVTAPWVALRRSKARMVFGSGFPNASPNPFIGLQAVLGDLPLRQAWAGFTTDPAYAGHAEDQVGRLATGLQADFLLLDRDPFTIPARELSKTVVQETWLSGRRVYQRP